MVLSRGCTCLRSALPLARARSAPTQQNLHSPTEFRTHSCWDILPQISQNTQNFLVGIFSHRFHRFTQNFLVGIFSHRFHTQKLWCFQGGALVSSAPTQQNLYSPTEFRTHSCWDILPQISQIYTELSCWEKFCEICGFCGKYTHPNICESEICGSFSTTNFRKASVTASWE